MVPVNCAPDAGVNTNVALVTPRVVEYPETCTVNPLLVAFTIATVPGVITAAAGATGTVNVGTGVGTPPLRLVSVAVQVPATVPKPNCTVACVCP